VTRALRAPPPPPRRSAIGKFFGVAADPRTYGALFYMLLSMITGTFYFTWVVAGASLSLGTLILIIGLPLLVLFFGSIRVLSLVEGRIVEALLGQRMPRRPLYTDRDRPWLSRIGDMFTDRRTWSTMLYLLLMLPLGIVYGILSTGLLSASLGMLAAPLLYFWDDSHVWVDGVSVTISNAWAIPLVTLLGLILLFVTLHVARGVGHMHGWLAKQLLVRSPVV
jgi:hypothetical protein